LYRSQVESRSRSPAHQGRYVREVLAGICVGQFLRADAKLPLLHPGDPLTAVIQTFLDAPYPVLAVVDAERRLQGVIDLEEVHLASHSPNLAALILAADLMQTNVVPLGKEDTLDRAQELFVENDLLALPVIDGSPERKVIGMVRRSDVAGAYLSHVHGPSPNASSP
jgi:CIC family chloride channel protein